MNSSYTLDSATHYRFVGKQLYRMPYVDAKGRNQPLKKINKVKCGGSIGYSLVIEGKRSFYALSKLKGMLVKEKMNISAKERGMPF